MNQTILFSPVGGTDPISMKNMYDGAMLHICRHYQPDKVILYMSKEILAAQDQDDRYRYCLNKLMELQGRRFDYRIIERLDLEKVYEFDYFYKDFKEIIENICSEMDATDQLLLNISSGTPAMKSGLAVLQTIGEYPCKLIQVTTPIRKMNEHTHEGYDVQTLWELDADNEPSAENRCHEIKCPTLSRIKQEEIVKQHVRSYEYSAAYSVAKLLPKENTEKYLGLLETAKERLLLNFSAVDKKSKVFHADFTPVKSGNERKYFEYALSLQVKMKKQEYGDFVRALSPLLSGMFELVLKNHYKIDIDNYCTVDRNTNVKKWAREKLNGTELLEVLNQRYSGGFEFGFVKTDHIKCLIDRYAEDQGVKQLIRDLRTVESEVRNIAAHQIVSVNADIIKDKTGFTDAKIMDKVKQLFIYTGIKIPKGAWNSYDEMNRFIIDKI